MIVAAKMGMDFRTAAPKKCQPDDKLVKQCKDIAKIQEPE